MSAAAAPDAKPSGPVAAAVAPPAPAQQAPARPVPAAAPAAAAQTPAAAARPAAPAAAPAVPRQQPQLKPQLQHTVAPAAAPPPAKVAPVDAVIDEVLGGGDLSYRERQLMADEVAYAYFSSVREAAAGGGQLDPATSARLNELAAMTAAEQDVILQKTNRVARRVLRPLGYKVLAVQGLDPATVGPAAARAALEADLSPQQQALVDAEAERLFKQVYLPELQAAAQDVGGLQNPDEAWAAFGRDIMSRQPEEPQQPPAAAIAVPAALAGAVVALVVSKVLRLLQRRRRRQRGSSRSDLESGSYYEDEGEQEVLTHTDSGQDDASAYAE